MSTDDFQYGFCQHLKGMNLTFYLVMVTLEAVVFSIGLHILTRNTHLQVLSKTKCKLVVYAVAMALIIILMTLDTIFDVPGNVVIALLWFNDMVLYLLFYYMVFKMK